MTMIKPITEILDIVAEETNCKCLDVFREQDQYEFHIAKLIDNHLNDLGKRIAMALEKAAATPEPDEFESWLAEKQKAEQLPEDTEENTTVASIDPDAEPRDKGRTPIDGGDPDNQPAIFNDKSDPAQSKESNESPTTEKTVSEPKKTRVDNESGSPVSGGDPDAIDTMEIAKELDEFRKDRNMTISNLVELIGVSNWTVSAMLRGQHVSGATRKKTRKAIARYLKKVVKPAKDPSPVKTNGSRNLGPAQFLQMKLTAWMEAEHIGISEAAGRLMVQESALRSIKAHLAVHPNIVRQLCRHIPSIEAEQAMLIAAAEQQEAA